MTNLLYPAVLGTILYTFGDEAWKHRAMPIAEIQTEAALLGLALVVLFSFDYAYTLTDNGNRDYGPWQFSLDGLALLLLFLAGKAILDVNAPEWAWLPVLLLAVRLSALLYEISRLPKSRSSASAVKAWRSYESDAYLVLVYLVVASLWLLAPGAWPWALVAAMLVDAACYLKRIDRREGDD